MTDIEVKALEIVSFYALADEDEEPLLVKNIMQALRTYGDERAREAHNAALDSAIDWYTHGGDRSMVACDYFRSLKLPVQE